LKTYDPTNIRNVAIVGHRGTGKTSLAEAMLAQAGAVTRLGRVEDGTTTCDFEPEEIQGQMTMALAVCFAEWKDVKINIIDTPGFADFLPEVQYAKGAVEALVMVVDAVEGVQVATTRLWRMAEESHLPVLIVINKVERENADALGTVESLREQFGANFVPLQVPLGREAQFSGVVDLVLQQAFTYEGGKAIAGEVPPDLSGQVQEMLEKVVEAAAESDDALIEKYLEGGVLSDEELAKGLADGVKRRSFFPVLFSCATKCIGVDRILDAILALLPAPMERPPLVGQDPRSQEAVERQPTTADATSAVVFKTMADPYVGKLTLFRVLSGTVSADSSLYNSSRGERERLGQLFVMQGKKQEPVAALPAGDIGAVAKLDATQTGDTLCDEGHQIVYPRPTIPMPVSSRSASAASRADEEKLSNALSRIAEEDTLLQYRRDPQTQELILSGMGQRHLDIVVQRLKRKFGVEVTLGEPKIAYRETIRGASRVQGRHKKQTGGRGQFGDVWVRFEPLPGDNQGFEFVNEVVGGAVPKQYIPAVEKGIREAMEEGVIAGYPMGGFRAILDDGSSHPVDSSELAFKLAGALAFKKGAKEARPVLLEPIVNLEVVTPEDCTGDVIGDLNGRRGRIQGMEPQGSITIVRAQVPLAELAAYDADLTSMTGGRGSYTMEPSHYEEVPSHLAERIIAQAQKAEA
jgi:elongation factor G